MGRRASPNFVLSVIGSEAIPPLFWQVSGTESDENRDKAQGNSGSS